MAAVAQSTRPAIRRTVLIDLCAVALILLAALLLRLPTLDLPLNEDGHPFRQTQTAYTSVLFHERGIDLWRPLLPALGPPWQVPFEFPSFQALASLVMDAGVEPELALRTTTLACFAAAAALLWILVRQRASRAEAYIALALFVATPFALLNSRIPSIEYLALAGMLAYLLTALRWREQLRDRWWLAAVLAGSFGLLTKVTTGPFIWLAIVADRPASAPTVMADLRAGRSALRAAWTARSRGPLGGRAGPVWRLVRLAALIAVPIAVVAVWTIHTDRVKQASPLTAPYQSTSLRDWNFGTLAQRLDPAEWSRIGERLVFEFGGPVLVALLVLGVVRSFRRDPQRPFWLAIVAMVVLPIATFFNLYVVHDYYLIAVSPWITLLQARGAGWLLATARSWRPGWPWRPAVAAGLVIAIVASFAAVPSYWSFLYGPPLDPDGGRAQAAELVAHTGQEDRVLVYGRDWSPDILYFARRWGLAIPDWVEDGNRTDLIDPALYEVASFVEPASAPFAPAQRWPIVGVLGRQTYALGRAAAVERGSGLLSADAGVLPPVPIDCSGPWRRSLVVPCDGAVHQVPMGWVRHPPVARRSQTRRHGCGSSMGSDRSRCATRSPCRAALSAAGMGGGVACNGTDGAPLVIERIVNAAFPTVETTGS